jgi:gluconokinase
MGVSGSGKSTIGFQLAQRLGWEFRDADDDHPAANVAKMQAGIPLTDEDRAPWLAILAQRIARAGETGQSLVLACSALKQPYRDQLSGGAKGVRFVYLKGDKTQIADRMEKRQHFMPPTLLDSQFAALEEPTDAIVVSIAQTPAEIVDEIVDILRREA